MKQQRHECMEVVDEGGPAGTWNKKRALCLGAGVNRLPALPLTKQRWQSLVPGPPGLLVVGGAATTSPPLRREDYRSTPPLCYRPHAPALAQHLCLRGHIIIVILSLSPPSLGPSPALLLASVVVFLSLSLVPRCIKPQVLSQVPVPASRTDYRYSQSPSPCAPTLTSPRPPAALLRTTVPPYPVSAEPVRVCEPVARLCVKQPLSRAAHHHRTAHRQRAQHQRPKSATPRPAAAAPKAHARPPPPPPLAHSPPPDTPLFTTPNSTPRCRRPLFTTATATTPSTTHRISMASTAVAERQ
ncbi:hypothetical protein Q7P35_010835 [Cladosporium inversicolor]